MTKVEAIKDYLLLNPNCTQKQVAEAVGCSGTLVGKVKNKTYFTPRKNAKERCLAKNQELLSKLRKR